MESKVIGATAPAEAFTADPRGFGDALRRALRTDEGWALLPGGGRWYGWTDGGCLLLADALRKLFGWHRDFELVAIVGSTGVGDHYLIRWGRWHLDADGACLAPELLRRWGRVLREPARVAPFAVATLLSDVPRDPGVSERIASHLAATFAV